MNRREFLACGAAATLAGTLGSSASQGAADPASTDGWILGCYTRPWDQHDYRVALDGIAEAGFSHAGILTAKGKSWVMITAETSPEEAAAIGAQVRQRGLKTASVYGDYRPTAVVADNVKALQALVGHCVACGSPDLLLGGAGDEKLYEPYYKSIAEVCDFAQAKGVRLTIKPHGGQIATGPHCRKAIESVGHRNFRLWYDPGNIFYYSDGQLDPVTDAATVDGLVAGMSVKDYRHPKEVLVTPGTGKVDFPRVFARLKQGGFTRGPLVVECLDRGEPASVTAQARKARLFLERLVGRTA
jgi:sugar phosphate isomerase/epimerase